MACFERRRLVVDREKKIFFSKERKRERSNRGVVFVCHSLHAPSAPIPLPSSQLVTYVTLPPSMCSRGRLTHSSQTPHSDIFQWEKHKFSATFPKFVLEEQESSVPLSLSLDFVSVDVLQSESRKETLQHLVLSSRTP